MTTKETKPTLPDMNDYDLTAKVNALAKYLGIEASEITRQLCNHYGMTSLEADGCEYAIATDSEADKAARESMEQSIWAFNASFILEACCLPLELEDGLKAWQEKECEGCNDALLRMVNKQAGNSFFEDAISQDGRGHFMSSYDGEENEQDGYYIYQLN